MTKGSGTRIATENLACIRGGRLLFTGVSFAAAAGEALLVTGPNGVGKSSLLRVLAGLLPPARGTVRFDPGAGDDAEGDIAYLGHADALKPLLTVAETLEFWSRIGGMAEDPTAAAAEATAAFALDPLLPLPCRYLSAGQRRRVALARVMAGGCPLWLLDEPTTALDAAGIAAFESALDRHRAGGGIAIMATHARIEAPGAAMLDLSRFAGGSDIDAFTRGLAVDEYPADDDA